MLNRKSVIFMSLVLGFASVGFSDVSEELDSLGGNGELLNRARALQPEKTIKIVQKRTVDRNWKHEISPEYINAVGGDTYLNTQMLGINYHLHINPQFAIGATYLSAFNELSKEGVYLIENDKKIPDVDAPQQGYEAVVNWYPIYGKFSLYDLGVVQFDAYIIGSYGQLELQSGETDMFSYGAGLGLWFNKYITTRFEIRSRQFVSQRFGGDVDMDLTTAGFSMGVML